MNGASLVLKTLEAEGVDVLFGYPGGAVMPIYDALYDSPLEHILTRHEQGAVLAADGYARSSGRIGVCLATSGPGATNLVTGIANASMDSIPLLAITGQVPTSLLGTDAFQEVDTIGITLPVVKHSFLVRDVAALSATLREAVAIACSGRPGPVLVDIPKDVMLAVAPDAVAPKFQHPSPPPPDPQAVLRAALLMRQAQRPVIYAGGGIGIGQFVGEFRRFVETTEIPVVTTLKGIGVLPSDHELLLGMLGMHGTRAANMAVQRSDLLLCIGARFDDRATGKLAEFAPDAKVIHFDVDPAEVGKLRCADVSVVGDVVPALMQLSSPLTSSAIDAWRRECASFEEDGDANGAQADDSHGPIEAPKLLSALSNRIGSEAFVTCDVGQHQMWVAQHCRFAMPEKHLSSGGLGTMGFGLPAAIGAQVAHPDALVVNVSGDGSIMMNLQELATLRRYGLPVKILLLDNQALGLVRQWQTLFFDGRHSEVDLSDNPDFVGLAEAFGICGFTIRDESQVEDGLDELIAEPGPALLHVAIQREANVWPLVPPNASNAKMLSEVPK